MRALLVLAALAFALPAQAQAPAAVPTADTGAATAMVAPALNVTSLKAALHFYVDAMGMKLLSQRGRPEHYETILGFPDNPTKSALILMSDETAKSPAPRTLGNGFDRLVMRVANLPALSTKMKRMGFQISDIRGSSEAGYRIAIATDADGFRLELVETTAPKGK